MTSGIRKGFWFTVVPGLLALSGSLQAQSCALCYQSAAASGPAFIQALRNGILILLVPPLAIGAGLAIAAYRKRNLFHSAAEISRADVPRAARREPLSSANASIPEALIPTASYQHEILTDILA